MWQPVDTRFFCPRCPVEIVDFGGGGEAQLLRSALESLSAVVLLHQIGTPQDLLAVLAQGEACASYMVLCGHGDETGLILGEYAAGLGIDVSMLVEGRLPAAALAGRVDLPGCGVINTCCNGGASEMASAFMTGKLRFYMGALDAVRGSAAPLFVTHLFYGLLERGLSVRQSWLAAGGYDDESGLFVLHDRSGRHRLHQSKSGSKHA